MITFYSSFTTQKARLEIPLSQGKQFFVLEIFFPEIVFQKLSFQKLSSALGSCVSSILFLKQSPHHYIIHVATALVSVYSWLNVEHGISFDFGPD